jgi:hypothetical protein
MIHAVCLMGLRRGRLNTSHAERSWTNSDPTGRPCKEWDALVAWSEQLSGLIKINER